MDRTFSVEYNDLLSTVFTNVMHHYGRVDSLPFRGNKLCYTLLKMRPVQLKFKNIKAMVTRHSLPHLVVPTHRPCFTDFTRHFQCNPMEVEFTGSFNFFLSGCRVYKNSILYSVSVHAA